MIKSSKAKKKKKPVLPLEEKEIINSIRVIDDVYYLTYANEDAVIEDVQKILQKNGYTFVGYNIFKGYFVLARLH